MKVGFTELVVVFVVALVVIGPDKLPEYARKLGTLLAQIRNCTAEATKDIRENITEPLEKAQRPLKEALDPFAGIKKEPQGMARPAAAAAGQGAAGQDTEQKAPAKEAAQDGAREAVFTEAAQDSAREAVFTEAAQDSAKKVIFTEMAQEVGR